MTYLFSDIDVASTERNFLQKAGQGLVYDLAQQYVDRVNADMASAISAFVAEQTDKHTERFKLPGGGYMQRRSQRGNARNRRASGGWDVAYPLEDFADGIEANDVALGYMTGQQLSNHINGVFAANANTVRHEILSAIFKNSNRTFVDEINSTLTLKPLANQDGTLYPPVAGSDAEAEANHYLEAGYTAITNTDDPFVTIVDKLESQFGTPTGGSSIVVFINNAQTSEVSDLAAFTPVAKAGVMYGNDTSLSTIPPQIAAMSSCRVLGYHDDAGCWIAEWRYIPATYMFGTHLDAPAPLKMRVDPADTGLGQGLQIVNRSFDYPTEVIEWRNRFGVAVGNRLNGVCMEIANGGSYTVPSQFA